MENPTTDARVHLVADTAGTSAFWRLVMQGQIGGLRPAEPGRAAGRVRPGRAAAAHDRAIQRRAVMPPSEVEQLAFDLLADLAPAGRAAGIGCGGGRVHQHGDRVLPRLALTLVPARRCAGGPGHEFAARGRPAGSFAQLRPVRVASTGSLRSASRPECAAAVRWRWRQRPEAPEFAAGSTSPACSPAPGDEPTLSSL